MMTRQPTLLTDRLVLRPFQISDALMVQRLAGDRAVAATTLRIPHPYPDGFAEQWIRPQREEFEKGKSAIFAVEVAATSQLCGAIGLAINIEDRSGELGYWIGVPFWNRGYCTEAARAIVHFGFTELHLHRIHASHFVANPASGRVLAKIGMRREGQLREHVLKWGDFLDVVVYGILKSEWRG
jgi:[ribosomal protein S5]-alanine N-acetyltransferase